MSPRSAPDWYLEGWVDDDSARRRFVLERLPARIGRRRDLEVRLDLPEVSACHAQVDLGDGGLRLRDLGSRNGTYLNGRRVSPEAVLADGDVIQIATVELVLRHAPDDDATLDRTAVFGDWDPAAALGPLGAARELRELIDHAAVHAVFQPIAALDGGPGPGPRFELLGRGDHPPLPASPYELFSRAERAGLAIELSRLFCVRGLREALALGHGVTVFVNTHPTEVDDGGLVGHLARVRARFPAVDLVLEVHEGAVTDPGRVRELRAALDALGVGIAYDDFGAGQARLLELVEVPPDYLKLDRCLIRDLDLASRQRRRLIGGIVETVRELGVRCVAEGIERDGELSACRDLGIDDGQGFRLGRPEPAAYWTGRSPESASRAAASAASNAASREGFTPRQPATTRSAQSR